MLFFFPLDFSTCFESRSTSESSEIFMRFSRIYFCVSKNSHRAPESDDFRPTHTLASNLSISATQSASQSSFIMLQEPVYTSSRRTLVSLPVTTPTSSSHHCTTVSCTLVVFKLIKLTTWLEFIYLFIRASSTSDDCDADALVWRHCLRVRDLGDRLHRIALEVPTRLA